MTDHVTQKRVMRFRGSVAWLVAALAVVVVVVFELALWLVLGALMTVGLVYESGIRLIRLVRPEKPIERKCLHCEQQHGFSKPQTAKALLKRYHLR